MVKPRNNLFFAGVILLLSMPTVASVAYFKITGDPTFRPLGITVASLTENLVGGTSRGITVRIEWGESSNTSNSKEQVRLALEKAMSVYPIDFLIRFENTSSAAIEIFFVVDGAKIGPYQLQDVSSGIPAALAAFSMKPPEES
ncbi:MAG: hypothetical protein V3V25_05675 [Paracoccaceae bacterium]